MLAALIDVGHLVEVAGYPLLFLIVMGESGGIPSVADQSGAPISGGILNGKALSLPKPQDPAIAKAAHASGTVTVQAAANSSNKRGCCCRRRTMGEARMARPPPSRGATR